MVQVCVHVLVEERGQMADVDHVPGVAIDRPRDAELHLVIVAVIIRVVARPEGGPVPLVGAGRVVQPVGGVEVRAANHGGVRHGASMGGNANGATSGRRRRMVERWRG